VFFLVAFIALSSAFNSPNSWHKSAWATAAYDSTAKSPSQARALSFGERVVFQRAIEEVYWRHRIWPKDNPDPKPSLDAVMSQAQLENKVEGYLRDSLVLEDNWQRPITVEQLQAEMDRMARETKQPEVLRELFEALGNDPAVIAECLARPILAERIIADLSGESENLNKRFVPAQAKASWPMSMIASGSADVVYTLPEISVPPRPTPGPSATPHATPPPRPTPPACTDSWTATSLTNAPSPRADHTAVWTGSEMIVWGGAFFDGNYHNLNTGGRYNPSTNSWTATSTTNAPSGRGIHAAVWTGGEMIVWGGVDDNQNPVNTGGSYDPGTDSWTATSTTNAPTGRFFHTAVWTGSEMIVWGGA